MLLGQMVPLPLQHSFLYEAYIVCIHSLTRTTGSPLTSHSMGIPNTPIPLSLVPMYYVLCMSYSVRSRTVFISTGYLYRRTVRPVSDPGQRPDKGTHPDILPVPGTYSIKGPTGSTLYSYSDLTVQVLKILSSKKRKTHRAGNLLAANSL